MAMQGLFFATGNPHKKAEMEALLPGIPLVLPGEGVLSSPFTPAETGGTFLENALIKARALWDGVHEPVLADDSGLCVDALGGRPGIFSARYGGEDASASAKNRLLLEEVIGVPPRERTCRFVCALVFFLAPDRFFVAQETLEGVLVPSLEECRGTQGFGYDPIVVVQGLHPPRTVAQLTSAEKNRLSHRGKAAASLQGIIRSSLPFFL